METLEALIRTLVAANSRDEEGMTARQALAALMLKDVLDATMRSNDRRRELKETIVNHMQKADGSHEELKIQMMELQKSCGTQAVLGIMKKHLGETAMVPNENNARMLISRLLAIDKKCVENENKAAAHQQKHRGGSRKYVGGCKN